MTSEIREQNWRVNIRSSNIQKALYRMLLLAWLWELICHPKTIKKLFGIRNNLSKSVKPFQSDCPLNDLNNLKSSERISNLKESAARKFFIYFCFRCSPATSNA